GAGRIGADRGGAPSIAQIVDEDTALAPRLGHDREIFAGTVTRHRLGHSLGEVLGLLPIGGWRERGHHMQALAAGGLDEAFETQFLETLPDLDGAGDGLLPRHILAWIEIEDD